MPSSADMSGPLLDVRGLGVDFRGVRALGEVSFEIHAGETLGLVGESGSGKSTLARALLRLIRGFAGPGVLARRRIFCAAIPRRCGAGGASCRSSFRTRSPSLDPRMTVGEMLAEPLRIFERAPDGRRAADADRRGCWSAWGSPNPCWCDTPHELSGGQCQRIGIARAMMLHPQLLVCDEPVSSLDVSIQGQIVNLLSDLQRELGTAMLFISHNLAVVRHISHRVAVIHAGDLIETATVRYAVRRARASLHPRA